MSISLPEELKDFVNDRARAQGYASSSEYMCELIRRDRDRVQFRRYLLEGIEATATSLMDKSYFSELRGRLKRRIKPSP